MVDQLQKNDDRAKRGKLRIMRVKCQKCLNDRAFVTNNFIKCTKCHNELENTEVKNESKME